MYWLALQFQKVPKWTLFKFWILRARLACVFKNWKLLFKNICGNTCGWKNVLKCVKCCLKTENSCLKTQTKHPLRHSGLNTTMYMLNPYQINEIWIGYLLLKLIKKRIVEKKLLSLPLALRKSLALAITSKL